MENTQKAIRILQKAAGQVCHDPGEYSSGTLTTLHNAVFYLLTGRIDGKRGVTHAA